MATVRLAAYPAYWLDEPQGFALRKRIKWSTSKKTQRGDIQIFAISSTDPDRRFQDDPRLDAVHSVWRALGTPMVNDNWDWPVQASFELLVKLEHPCPKIDLLRAKLLNRGWYQHYQGQLITGEDVATLAEVLSAKNSASRSLIYRALGLRTASTLRVRRINSKSRAGRSGSAVDALVAERSFLEGELRAAKQITRNPQLRAAAKERWGLRCACCGFGFESFYGDIAKGIAIVHHMQPLGCAKSVKRRVNVDDVRIVCANCHQVIHARQPPVGVDELAQLLRRRWIPWSTDGISRRQVKPRKVRKR